MILFSGVLVSCEEDSIDPSTFWSPMLSVERGNGQAILFLTDPRTFSLYVAPGPVSPDYFKILISDDLENFSLYQRIDISTTRVLIDNLTNGKPYYVLVTTHKGESVPLHADTLMTIPSPERLVEPYLPAIDFSIEEVSTSFDMGYLSYRRGSVVYYTDNVSGSGTINSPGTFLQSLSWSDTMNKVVYITSKEEGNTGFSFELLEPESGITSTLMEVPYHNYYIANPTFTPDGSKVAFLSNENNSEKYINDLWTLDLTTKEKNNVSNFEDIGFHTESKYDWANSGDEVYLGGRYYLNNDRYNIYKFNIVNNTLTRVIESQWDDWSPSLSPDNTKIAFISGRTGRSELWIYDLTTFTFSQVTGGSSYSFESRSTNLQWLSNSEMLITLYDDSKSIAVKIRVD